MLTLKQIQQLLSLDIQKNNKVITKHLKSDVILINQISQHIINSGGKRIRPLLLMLMARALAYEGENHTKAAAIIEFIHTATLLHDDVVDGSYLRRGKKTANNIFGNSASVLTGDYLYSRAFQMMVTLNQMKIMEIFADATNTIAEGEVLQLLHCNSSDITETQYMQIIYCKTAKLFEAACDIATVIAKTSSILVKDALRKYGIYLGKAFQITDDILDYTSDNRTLGKSIGKDLLEGKSTLPLIYTLEMCNMHNQKIIRQTIEQGYCEDIDMVIKIMNTSGAIERAKEKAKHISNLAISMLGVLEASEYKNALISLAHLSVERIY